MQARSMWWVVAGVIAAAGVAAIVKIYSQHDIGYELSLTLLATVVSGAVGLSGLALLDRAGLRPLAVALLLLAVATYVIEVVATWDDHFAERHERFVATATIVALFAALVGTLAAMIHAPSRPLRLMTLAAQTVIVGTAGYTLTLVWTISEESGPSRSEGRLLEALIVASLAVYLFTPVMQRALRRPAALSPPGERIESGLL